MGNNLANRELILGFERGAARRVTVISKKIASYRQVIGITTSTGIKVRSVSKHLGIRGLQRQLSIKEIKNALIKPLRVGKIRVNSKGRISQEFVGDKARVRLTLKQGML